ncbi:MAG: 16S rRNA (guanine(966)-N(2))-methyltransferase RsmD [Bacillota bacterium]
MARIIPVLKGVLVLRVISGSAKKRRLKAPPGRSVRPTADRVKEALFNILAERIPGCTFLDLYAGSGGIGIEALSRGADYVTFVEKDARVLKVLGENLQLTGLEGRAETVPGDVDVVLERIAGQGRKFDVIFMDPPYRQNLAVGTLARLSGYGLLRDQGLLIIESGKEEKMPVCSGLLKMIRQERYGDTMLSFYVVEQTGGEVDNFESGSVSR